MNPTHLRPSSLAIVSGWEHVAWFRIALCLPPRSMLTLTYLVARCRRRKGITNVEWMAEGNKVFEIVTDYLHTKFVSRSCGTAEEWPKDTCTQCRFFSPGPFRGVSVTCCSLHTQVGSSDSFRTVVGLVLLGKLSPLAPRANVIKGRKLWEYANWNCTAEIYGLLH